MKTFWSKLKLLNYILQKNEYVQTGTVQTGTLLQRSNFIRTKCDKNKIKKMLNIYNS